MASSYRGPGSGGPARIIGSVYRTTADFVAALDRAGELRRIRAKVSPVLEIAAIADRCSKSAAPNPPSDSAQRVDPAHFDRGGPALLFERVIGSNHSILINAFGSYLRMEMALGCDDQGHTPGGFDAIAQRIGQLVRPARPRSLREAVALARRFAPLIRMGPKRLGRRGACQQVVTEGDGVDLTALPLIRCWPLDGNPAAVGYPEGINADIPGVDVSPEFARDYQGRYITLGGVHTIHARDAGQRRLASHNIGMYRVQLLGPRHMAMHWHVHHDGAAHWRSWKDLGKPMPVAIALGGESVLPYAATCPLPPGMSELLMAGFLNRRGIRLCRTLSLDPPLWVPANSDLVIEGYVSTEAGAMGWDPRDANAGPLGPGAAFEGPFGDHTGFYSLPDRCPVLTVTAITRREGAIYPTTIVGMPPQEDYYLGKATERIMLPLLQTIIPDIEDYDLPMFGAFHNAVFIRINKQYPLHARRVMHGVWGAGQMSWTKCVFVVDDDVNVHDVGAVMRAVARNCHPGRDIEQVCGPVDILDHAAPGLGAGTKIGFDATRKIPGEGPALSHPQPSVDVDAAGQFLAAVRSVAQVADASMPERFGFGWLFVGLERTGIGQVREVIEQIFAIDAGAVQGGPAFVVAVDHDVNVHDDEEVLFHWLANMSPGRDMVRSSDRARIGFDSTSKGPGDAVRSWPPVMRVSEEMREQVDRRWSEYGI